MKTALRWLGWTIAAAIAGYFVWFVSQSFHAEDMAALISPWTITAILIAACLYALIIPISGKAWDLLLRSQGERWRPARLVTIMAITQLAKYIPGNVAQHVGRAAMSLREGMKFRAFTASVVQETFLAVAASIAVGTCLMMVSPMGIAQIPTAYRNVVLIALCVAVGAVLVLASGSSVLPTRIREHPWFLQAVRLTGPGPGARTTALVFSAYCLNYFVIGIGLWVIGQSMGLATNGLYALLTGSFCLAWLLGFAMPGSPAGLGVREGVMALLLSGSVPDHQVIALVLAIRLATVAGDGLCFGLGLLGMRNMDMENT
jgi:uncharacterized membrane protein YbhN (UPF0104 family)